MKRVLKIFLFGVCLGLLLVVIQTSLQIDRDTFLHYYWLIAPAILLGVILLNVVYNLSYQKRMNRLIPLLDNGSPEAYTAKAAELLRTAKGEKLRSILKINLAAGYIELKQYDNAIKLLEPLPDKQLAGTAVKTAHRINLCLSYFFTKQFDRAAQIYQESQPLFARYQNDQNFGGNIAALDILAALGSEQYAQAGELLDSARKVWTHPRLQDSFRQIESLMQEMNTI